MCSLHSTPLAACGKEVPPARLREVSFHVDVGRVVWSACDSWPGTRGSRPQQAHSC
jgi:hypothetical protein